MNNMGAIMEEPEYEISVADMYEGKVALYVLSRISGKGADRKFIKEDYSPLSNFSHETDTDNKEGVLLWVIVISILWPVKRYIPLFGFGLSYTDFEFTVQHVHLVGEEFVMEVVVKNKGEWKGKEVLQLCLSKSSTHSDEPYQVLVQFEKNQIIKSRLRRLSISVI
ncbi:hypothetical protein H8356DRAFT_1285497 [Neocallimastix lanati (nom. inval.)]|nr:hypothetical protein H8356DRAFT_1285497 [Neocallimastix sp. JGI-2020a]